MQETDVLDDVELKEPERTRFLSVLCILTWLGSWFMAMYCLIWIFRNGEVEDTGYYYFAYEEEYLLIKIGFFSSLASAFAAYFIWQLKRFGLFIYMAGQIPLAFYGIYVYVFLKPIETSYSFYFMGVFIAQLLFIVPYMMHWNIINSKR